MGFKKFQSMETKKYISPVPGIKVLVVDCDLASLATVSKLLLTLGYEVVTATLASNALSIVQEKKNELYLVLMEVHLPDMEGFVLIENIKESSDLPIFILSADGNEFSMLEALCKGAKRYFIKPVMAADLSGLWQFAMWKRNDIIVNNGIEFQPFMKTVKESLQSGKRKQKELLDEGGEKIEPLKKRRISWTDDLHKKFLEAVKLTGIHARPKKIQQIMNVPGLTRDNVSSYLQKYRQSLKREADSILQQVNKHISDLHLKQQGVAHKPAFYSHYQKDLSSCMSLQFLGTPAHFPSQKISRGHDSTLRKNQLCLPWKLQGFENTNSGFGELKINGNGEECGGFSKVGNATDGKISNGDSILSHVDHTASKNEMQCSTLQANDMRQQFGPPLLLPLPPPPSNVREQDIFGAGGKIDEIFYASKGTQQFNEDDLNKWLSCF